MRLPKISIIIVTLNSQRTLKDCLAYIKKQAYSKIDEVLIVDGGSSDNTLGIAKESKLPIKIINGGFKNNQEARRAVGVTKARNEICAFIDSDNFLLDENWLHDMIEPLLQDKEIIATQTLRYSAPRESSLLNRYFGLIGGADPVSYYLGKNDRLSWLYDDWNLLGRVIEKNKKYLKIEFDPQNYPTVGCNGIVFRKSILLKSKWGKPENYLHADVFVDVGKLGYNKFGIVRNEIFHNTAGDLFSFLKKRRIYMQTYHQKMNKARRQLVFNPNKPKDVFKLLLFISLSFTIIEPVLESFIGYFKKRDFAWFLHPFVSLGMSLVYGEATIRRLVKK